MGKSKKRKRGPQHPPLTVELRALEIAAGHDGFLRGKPEPVILLAALWVGAHVRTIGRVATHFGTIGRYPCTVAPTTPAVISARKSGGGRLVILAIALEEDATTDVARIYALLEAEQVSALRFWASGAEVPAPAPIEALALHDVDGPSDGHPTLLPVHVLEGTRDLGDGCTADSYVGACAIGVPSDGGLHDLRLPFTSADRRNDWTALLSVQAAPARVPAR